MSFEHSEKSQKAEKSIRELRHGLTSPQRTRELSVVLIDREIGGRTLSVNDSMGTLDDRRMGPIARIEKCLTCGGTEETCPGHLGLIELECGVIPDMYMSQIKKAMRSVCQTPGCNAIFPFENKKFPTRKVMCPECDEPLPTITISKSKRLAMSK